MSDFSKCQDSSFFDRLEEAFSTLYHERKDNVSRNVSIGAKTTYRAGGSSLLHFLIDTSDDLILLAEVAKISDLPILFIGKGSNLLISEAGFAGISCCLSDKMPQITIDIEKSLVTCAAAASLPQIARQSAASGMSGLEWMVGIPGSCGGAIRMNAGGHGSEVASVLTEVDVFDIKASSFWRYKKEELLFSYRKSPFEDRHVITTATFSCTPGDSEKSAEKIQEIVAWRREHQPGGKNAGSVFKNPDALSAGQLIDESGLKGFRYGSATVSDKHANFFQLDAGGKSDDVFELIKLVRSEVFAKTGVLLEPELRLIGFDTSLLLMS